MMASTRLTLDGDSEATLLYAMVKIEELIETACSELCVDYKLTNIDVEDIPLER